MFALPTIVKGIYHPLVRRMYLKTDFASGSKNLKVLVIEILGSRAKRNGSQLEDVFVDLKDLKKKVEAKIGSFDRVDIRTC